MSQNQNEVSQILRDIELGPADRKRAALGKLRVMPEVPLGTIQSTVGKIFDQVPDGSALKFFAASNLAVRGDQRPEVTNALMPYMANEVLKDENGKPVAFPWLMTCAQWLSAASPQDEGNLRLIMYDDLLNAVRDRDYPIEMTKPGFAWQHSAQLATLESISYLRHDDRVTETGIEAMENLSEPIWRALFLYSLASLGNPKSRPVLEYYRDQYPSSVEGGAARLGLEHFGNKAFWEFIQLHQTTVKKGGCFIATAVYGRNDSPEVEIFRRLRDEFLMTRSSGRLFISLYYSFSPRVAELIGKSMPAKKLVRAMLLTPALRLIEFAFNKRVSQDERLK